MTETLINEIIQHTEKMNEYQLRVLLGFVKRLLNL